MYYKSGQRQIRQTTQGWNLLILWKDGSEQWIPLGIMKETNPVKVAEFAVSRSIDNEPAFAWWVPYTLRQCDKIISTVNACVKRVSHKYGIELPTSIKHAYEIDKENGHTF